MVAIAIDVMGGDSGPSVVFQSAEKILTVYSDLELCLFCTPEALSQCCPGLKQHPRVSFDVTNHVVSQNDWPLVVLKEKQRSTMWLALSALKQQRVEVVVSAGNTGALVAVSKYLIGLIPGVDRPALAAWLPDVHGGQHLLLDVGANTQCNSELLVQWAMLGCLEFKQKSHVKTPKVALLNIGTEIHKGGEYLQVAYQALTSADMGGYFVGFIEGQDLLTSKADIIVCDGLLGNASIKAMEGLISYLNDRSQLAVSGRWSFGRLWRFWLSIWLRYSLRAFGGGLGSRGAVLMGLRQQVVKCHGHSCVRSWFKAIDLAYLAAKNDSENKNKQCMQLFP